METPNLDGAREIHASATRKLDEIQQEVASLQHSLTSDYLALRGLVGREEAERFIRETVALPF